MLVRESEEQVEAKAQAFVRPLFSSEAVVSRAEGGNFIYKDGTLYEENDLQQQVLVNASLPKAEWYEMVELAQSPSNAQEIWMSIGGRELHYSTDGGRTFVHLTDISHTASISFVPSLESEQHFSIYLFGTIKFGRPGGYTSTDFGATWVPYEPSKVLPLVS